MVEFLHFDIQSTGQKSHCVNTAFQPSQCYVLIRQSDSPCPYQFQVSCFHAPCMSGRVMNLQYTIWHITSTQTSPIHLCTCNPWSQSFSQSYGSILPTSLTYIVLSTRGCSPWRPAAVMSTTSRKGYSLPWIFTGHPKCSRHNKLPCFARPKASPPVNPFPRPHKRSSRKDNSTQDLSWRLQVRLRRRVRPTTGSGILTGFPFDRQSKSPPFQHS